MAIHEILQIIAFSATVIFQVSGLQPVLGYWRDQSVPSSASPVPFFSMVASSCAWSLYGGLTSDLSILLANLFGVVLGLFYCYSFCSLSKKRRDVAFFGHGGPRDDPGLCGVHTLAAGESCVRGVLRERPRGDSALLAPC
eukprot:Rmarinus@m.1919